MLFGIESNVSKNIDVYEIAVHNHLLAESVRVAGLFLEVTEEVIMMQQALQSGLL